MISKELKLKYQTEALFHSFANAVSKILIEEEMTLNEIQQAIDVALILRREHEMADDEDPSPWCSHCGARTPTQCPCGPIPEND